MRKRYYYKYIKKLNWPELQTDFRLGTSVHKLAFYYLKGFSIEHLLQSADEKVLIHWNALKNHLVMSYKPVATEWGFTSRIKNSEYWLDGRIDAIFYDETQNKYIIADWKTGKNVPKNPESSFQTIIYLYSFFKARKDLKLDLSPEDLIFQYVKTPECNNINPICYSMDKKREYESLLLETIDSIKNAQEYPAAKNCALKDCQYGSICLQK